MKFACPNCSQRISASPEDAGAEGVCPSCNCLFVVPCSEPQSESLPLAQPAGRHVALAPAKTGGRRWPRVGAWLLGAGIAIVIGILPWKNLRPQATPEGVFKAFIAATLAGDWKTLESLQDPRFPDKITRLQKTRTEPHEGAQKEMEKLKSISVADTKIDGDYAVCIIRWKEKYSQASKGKGWEERERNRFDEAIFVRLGGKWYVCDDSGTGIPEASLNRLGAWVEERETALKAGE